MSLIAFKTVKAPSTLFKRPVFLKLTAVHVVRILDTKGHVTDVHWINRIPIECLKDDCPICKNNLLVKAENPNNFWTVSSYSRKAPTFYLNVLDRTPTKVCPNCEHENTIIGNMFSPTCKGCGGLITNVADNPVNKIKILSRSQTFGDELNRINDTNLGQDRNKLGIQNYDIQIMVGSNKQPFAQALLDRNDAISYNKEDLFDLPEVPIKLTASEILDFQAGTSLKDIFASRNTEVKPASKTQGLNSKLLADVEADITSLLG